jgi:hypothetical protein
MKNILIFLVLMLTNVLAFGQNRLGETAWDVAERNSKLIKTEQGYVARNLEDLVDSSVVIVRGQYGGLQARYMDLGEGVSAQRLAEQLKLPIEQIEQMGFPIAIYEFKISEVIKDSDLVGDASTISVQLIESEDAFEVVPWLGEWRSGEHLLFLDLGRGSTYSIRGQMFDMRSQNGMYIFKYGESDVDSTAFGSESGADFISEVRRLSN